MQKPFDIFKHSFLGSLASFFITVGLFYMEDVNGVSDAGVGIIFAPFVLAFSFGASLLLGNMVLWLQKRKGSTNKIPLIIAVYLPALFILIISIMEYQTAISRSF